MVDVFTPELNFGLFQVGIMTPTAPGAAYRTLRNTGSYASYALALDFDSQDYWVNGTDYATLASVPGYTFTRTGEQGAIDSDNTIDYFAANTPAINGNGYHAYGALTNIFTRSQEFELWALVNVTAAANTQTAPDGTTTADTITEDATNTDHYLYNTGGVFTAVEWTNSIFLKQGTARYVQMIFATAVNSTAYANFDLQTGTKTAEGGGGTGYIVSVGNGWYRCVLVGTAAAVTAPGIGFVFINSGTDARAPVYLGSSRTIHAWQSQHIVGHFQDGGPIIHTIAATASIGESALATTANPISSDSDFIWWGVWDASPIGGVYKFLAEMGKTTGGLVYIGRLGDNFMVGDGVGEIAGPVAITMGRNVIMMRRRAGKTTVAVKTNGVVTIGAESAVRALGTPNSSLWVAQRGSLGGLQIDAPVEGVFIRTGTFSDTDINTILTDA